MLKLLVLLQILQDCQSEETQMHWKKEMIDMSSRVEGLNLTCVDDLRLLLVLLWVADVQRLPDVQWLLASNSEKMGYMTRKEQKVYAHSQALTRMWLLSRWVERTRQSWVCK
jgi:hypothetical protein